MIRCDCARIGERQLRRIIRGGARTTAAVGAACGAGTWCGGCLEDLAELVAKEARRGPSWWRGRSRATG
jgi:bacterioferritin-associated ferredoxin